MAVTLPPHFRAERSFTVKDMVHIYTVLLEEKGDTLLVGGRAGQSGLLVRLSLEAGGRGAGGITASLSVPSPILSGVIHQGRVYCGSAGGAIFLVDLESLHLVETIPAQPNRFDISHMVLADANHILMAFRRVDGAITNWCYQELFTLPKIESVVNQFTGHYPGPCSSLQVFQDKVYFTDSTWRGRWDSLLLASPRIDRMWQNGQTISRAVAFDNFHYILFHNGRLDAFPVDNYGMDGAAPRSLQIEVKGHVTAGGWKFLLADPVRGVLWAGNDEGFLVEIPPDLSGVTSVIKTMDQGHAFDSVGAVLPGGTLLMVDSGDIFQARLLFLQFSSDCKLGSQYQCSCRVNEMLGDDSTVRDGGVPTTTCHLRGPLVVTDVLELPDHVILSSTSDITLTKGSVLRIPLSSSVQTTGSLSIDSASMEVTDSRRRPPVGKIQLIHAKGGIKGVFSSASLSRRPILMRLLFCAQLLNMIVLIKDGNVDVELSVRLFSQCRTPMVTIPVLLFFLSGAAYLYFAFSGSDEKEDAKKE